jgi:hypothetical protein
LSRSADEGGDMNIMAAGMHDGHLNPVSIDLPDFGFIWQAIAFEDWEAVHVGTQHNGWSSAISDHTDNTCAADFLCNLNPACSAQFSRHNAGGARFAEGQFWIGVQILPQAFQRA